MTVTSKIKFYVFIFLTIASSNCFSETSANRNTISEDNYARRFLFNEVKKYFQNIIYDGLLVTCKLVESGSLFNGAIQISC